MARLRLQNVSLVLIAVFGACGTVWAAGAPVAPMPGSATDQAQTAQAPATFDNVPMGYMQGGGEYQPSELTLGNFFDAGWNDEWVKRQRATGTPDMALLRVSTNFLEREVRVNYFLETNVNSTTTRTINETDALIAWSFNRRFMIEITGAYQWNDPRTGAEVNGGNPGIVGRFALVDTESSALALNLKATEPDPILGVTQTAFAYGLSGFEDLAYWFGLDRTGLYYSFQFDTYAGPAAVGARTTTSATTLPWPRRCCRRKRRSWATSRSTWRTTPPATSTAATTGGRSSR